MLRPENGPNCAFRLVSAGRRFGDPGYYRIHRIEADTLRVKYLPIKEIIEVYEDDQRVPRTDHTFRWWGSRFLTLHYKIVLKASLVAAGGRR